MREPWLMIGLVIASLLLLVVALCLGSTPLGFARTVQALLLHGTPGDQIVIWEIRLPRTLAAFAVGAMLGLSGAALQGLLRNPLAEPGVLGIATSAALFATVTLYFGFSALSGFVLPLAAVTGAMLATLFLAAIAVRLNSVVTLILVGIGISSFSGALIALLLNLAPNPFSLSDMVNWTMGTVANRSFADLMLALPFLVIGFMMILTTGKELAGLTLGEEAAAGIGVDLKRVRLKIVIGTGLCTGAAVSVAGAVGFVGIVAPHLIRPYVRYKPSATLLPAALLGGILLVLADILIRLAPTNSELKLGVVAALFGAPIFVWIAARRQSDSLNE